MRSRVAPALLLLALLLPSVPISAQSTTSTDPDVSGPDAEGAFLLRYVLEAPEARVAALRLLVVRSDADGDVEATRELGQQALASGANTLEVAFLPAEGPGHYEATLEVDGVAAAGPRAFEVEDAGASGSVAFHVADEPTWLNLTSDDVNAANKTKSPGEVLVTRATLADGNGLGDVGAVLWRVDGPGGFRDEGSLAAAADLELRYDRPPIPAGDHTLTLRAVRGESALASASRTFRIREVAPTFVSGALLDVAPDENTTRATTFVLADRNGFPTAPLEARVYRGSTRVEGSGFAAALGAWAALPDANGSARAAFPLTLAVPARATPGAYRVSVYADGSLLGSMPFQVLELPTLATVNATTDRGALLLTARGAGNGTFRATLDGVEASAPFANGSATLRLEPARRNATLAWNATLHARADGPPLASRAGAWSAPYDGPAFSLAPLATRRLPAAWRLVGEGGEAVADLAGANATVSFTRWDGTAEPRLAARVQGDRLRVEGPADLAAGRYHGRVVLAWANGSASEATFSFDAGPWTRVGLGQAVVEGRVARVPVLNEGGLVVRRLVVEAEPAANLTLEAGNATLRPTSAGGRAAFSGLALAPGETATLRVELPAGQMASGRHEVRLRVLARVDLA